MPTTRAPGPFPFEQYRRLQFGGDRPPCPRCGASRIQRWGTFSGRRRYRCVACSRTFSDFTNTPLAHLKRIDRWPAFCRCMMRSLSVRRTASILELDKHTAFRWRHRILQVVRVSAVGPLGPCVGFQETWFLYSEKGQRRRAEEAPREAAGSPRQARARVWAIVARDERGRTASAVVGFRRPTATDLQAAMASRLLPRSELVSAVGPYGAVARLADRIGASYRRAATSSSAVSAARDYVLALRLWIRRFRGVATRYLDNYLAWHGVVEAAARAAASRAGLRWLLGARRPATAPTGS
jgi:transposase-like protein